MFSFVSLYHLALNVRQRAQKFLYSISTDPLKFALKLRFCNAVLTKLYTPERTVCYV